MQFSSVCVYDSVYVSMCVVVVCVCVGREGSKVVGSYLVEKI